MIYQICKVDKKQLTFKKPKGGNKQNVSIHSRDTFIITGAVHN